MKALGKTVIGGALFLSVFSAASAAQAVTPTIVTWERITGRIRESCPAAWSAGSPGWLSLVDIGRPRDRRFTNSLDGLFDDAGLVLAGGNSIGTTGPVTSVSGPLVRNPSAKKPRSMSTVPVPLDAQGNASFFGWVTWRPRLELEKAPTPAMAVLIHARTRRWFRVIWRPRRRRRADAAGVRAARGIAVSAAAAYDHIDADRSRERIGGRSRNACAAWVRRCPNDGSAARRRFDGRIVSATVRTPLLVVDLDAVRERAAVSSPPAIPPASQFPTPVKPFSPSSLRGRSRRTASASTCVRLASWPPQNVPAFRLIA